MDAIAKHQKAINILELIQSLNIRIASHERWSDKFSCSGFDTSHYENRITIDNKIKERLQNYYNKNFNLCTHE